MAAPAAAAGVRVDQAGAHRGSRREPELGRGRLGKAPAERGAGRRHLGADAREALVGEHAEPHRPEVAFVPALLMSEVGPFAGHRADRPRQAAGGAPCQEIGQVEELPGGVEDLRTMLAEPEQLWGLHLGRDRPADVFQDGVPGGVDPLGLRHRPVIHPDDDVA